MTDEAWADASFREQVGGAVDSVLTHDAREGAMELWRRGLSTSEFGLAGGIWNIWGRITDEFTHPKGDSDEGARLALEAAAELKTALGNEERERAYCDHWIYGRLDIS